MIENVQKLLNNFLRRSLASELNVISFEINYISALKFVNLIELGCKISRYVN